MGNNIIFLIKHFHSKLKKKYQLFILLSPIKKGNTQFLETNQPTNQPEYAEVILKHLTDIKKQNSDRRIFEHILKLKVKTLH